MLLEAQSKINVLSKQCVLLGLTRVSSVPFLDFDEQTADDWDVDMSVYYDKGMKCFVLHL